MSSDPPAYPGGLHGAASRRQQLPDDVSALPAARLAVERHARGLISERRLDDAVLLTSELVTNAILHGAPPIALTVLCEGRSITVAVTDGLDSWPDPTPPIPAPGAGGRAGPGGALDVGGRGLALVAAVSTSWGVHPNAPAAGKTVWFELGSDGPATGR